MNRREKGRRGEEEAVSALRQQGYEILERNYRFERGEIDIVAKEGGDLVFIEVKARHSDRFGSPEESISEKKEEQMKKVAEGYLLQRSLESQRCRFDVVAITYDADAPRIRIIRNAFF